MLLCQPFYSLLDHMHTVFYGCNLSSYVAIALLRETAFHILSHSADGYLSILWRVVCVRGSVFRV